MYLEKTDISYHTDKENPQVEKCEISSWEIPYYHQRQLGFQPKQKMFQQTVQQSKIFMSVLLSSEY